MNHQVFEFLFSVSHAASTSISNGGGLGDIASEGPVGITIGAYRLGFLIAGLIAFGILLYAAALAATSGGNPSKLSLAKEWAFAAISGLALLIFAFIILRTINPALVEDLSIPELTPPSPPEETGQETGNNDGLLPCGVNGQRGTGFCADPTKTCVGRGVATPNATYSCQ